MPSPTPAVLVVRAVYHLGMAMVGVKLQIGSVILAGPLNYWCGQVTCR